VFSVFFNRLKNPQKVLLLSEQASVGSLNNSESDPKWDDRFAEHLNIQLPCGISKTASLLGTVIFSTNAQAWR
jgi:hypothetical protein